MDFEGLAELLVPLVFLGIIGGLVALRMLRPYGDRILELIREIQQERHQALAETRDLQALRDRIDMLAERQDFLETLVERRLDESEQAELERIRREELDPSAGLRPPDLASGPRGREDEPEAGRDRESGPVGQDASSRTGGGGDAGGATEASGGEPSERSSGPSGGASGS
jgi:uncharacterized membrane protein YgcG